MDNDMVSLLRDVAAIVLMAAGAVFFAVLTLTLIKLSSPLRRTAHNFEKVSASAAEASPNIVAVTAHIEDASRYIRDAARDISQATPVLMTDLVAVSENIKETTGYVRDAAKDVAGATPVLKWLGPAGAAANTASSGIGRIGRFLSGLFRR